MTNLTIHQTKQGHEGGDEQELALGAETVKDLDVEEGSAGIVRGGNSAGATRPGTTH